MLKREDKKLLEDSLRSLINSQAESKGIVIEINEIPKLLNMSYVSEVINILSIKNLSDRLFEPERESQRKVDLIQDVASRKVKPGLIGRVREWVTSRAKTS